MLSLILRWLIPLWLMGWLVLPVARRVFPNLPDGGLAAGRVLAIALCTLAAFWAAALRLAPLSLAPLWLAAPPLLCCLVALARPQARRDFAAWARANHAALLWSDAVLVGAFAFFLWIRLRHPGINDLEKPMDSALMAGLAHAVFLPIDNPWLSGTPLTNYYYFGHLMGALMARALGTPIYLAYNLVQPVFCALFISTLWALCAALSGSCRRGLVAMSVVALLGHFEPLRQIAAKHMLWPLDWWTTSRVIPNTINEYPIFTLAIGDAHAHFFALALAAAFFSLCHALFAGNSPRRRVGVALLLGALLGIIVMTNTWDLPAYALLAIGCALFSLRPGSQHRTWQALWSLVPLLVARLVAWPYLKDFHAQVKGVRWDPWLPDPGSALLLWGPMLLLALWSFAIGPRLPSAPPDTSGEAVAGARMRALLVAVGTLCLLAPCLFYIVGYFGGDLVHQDTVFKFGLQAWLLLGTGLGCAALERWSRLPRAGRAAWAVAGALLWSVPLLCAVCVVWTRAVRDVPRAPNGGVQLSLDGAGFLPASDAAAVAWLSDAAQPGDIVLEAAGQTPQGAAGGDFDPLCGRVSALSGVPTVLGWPQHVWFWGADWGDINRRFDMVRAIYNWRDDGTSLQLLRGLNVRYIFVGDVERRDYPSDALERLRAALPVAYQDGQTFIARVPAS